MPLKERKGRADPGAAGSRVWEWMMAEPWEWEVRRKGMSRKSRRKGGGVRDSFL